MLHTHQHLFYELMWRANATGAPYPLPWWVQQYFRHWVEPYDEGLFTSKQAAFGSNAYYRYWNMVGVKDHEQECLVGQAGEIEPVYDTYSMYFFLFDPASRQLFFPQQPAAGTIQYLQDDYLPIIHTEYKAGSNTTLHQKVIATVAGGRQRSVVLARFTATNTQAAATPPWLCIAVSGIGVSGFNRDDKAGRISANRMINFMQYTPAERRVEANTQWGPLFDKAPTHFGLYGNPGNSTDPNYYLHNNPFADLANNGTLNHAVRATDQVGGLCTAVFAWPLPTATGSTFALNVTLPVDDYRGAADLAELQAIDYDQLEEANRSYWQQKLLHDGLRLTLPPAMRMFENLFRICRANLLILADGGQIHPGPTIYDSFWVRDSSVEGIACALAGDGSLTYQQFGTHYLRQFHHSHQQWGDVSLKGFFGAEHELNDREWDCNGQALWAFGIFDRISGASFAFGQRVFHPYTIEAARWIRDNRSTFGLLKSGWSAEHLGDKDKPHYWDDLWGLAGLYEAGKMAERMGAPETAEVWQIYDDLRIATVSSILWALDQQRRMGFWETFIPTGPADVGLLNSTMVGTVAYFHPCRLYIGKKLGNEVDKAARLTLETIWAHFIRNGGFEHNSAWNAFGPYLTLQLAHAFLYLGQTSRMKVLLDWVVFRAAFAKDNTADGAGKQIVLGAWNEQHCYPVASNFAEVPSRPWYMGDIPHGWACGEFILLLRDMLFFEVDDDNSPHVYIGAGLLPDWLHEGDMVEVSNAPTTFGVLFGFTIKHEAAARKLLLHITQPLPGHIRFIFPCHFGSGVHRALVSGNPVEARGNDVLLPGGSLTAEIFYKP